ncbi:MAG: sigma-54 dependent transcriptional regulator [Flavobacteriales bacterium]|nr:sigma-54 dependent transcriptional regulator [Flavobacteriales bacterium]
MSTILIVEDESAVRRVLKNVLEQSFTDVLFLEASNGKDALSAIANEKIDAVLCDIKMPAPDGVEVLTETMKTHPHLPFIMLSGHGDIDTAVECLKKGAVDYICKPPDLTRLSEAIRMALSGKKEEEKTADQTLPQPSKYNTDNTFFEKIGMIGKSEPILRMQDLIRRVAVTDAKVLVRGENGTGKELVVKALHALSKRRNEPLVEVNCAAIPSELIESELFGHEKGAFTSALKMHRGRFEQADGGTLFLDEIGDMSLSAQAKVLRVVQEGRLTRVGADKDIEVNVRLVAATNQNLKDLIGKNMFREDLYHRISVVEICVPPLIERTGDVPILAKHFLDRAVKENALKDKKISEQAIKVLEKYQWSGNVRQLQNVMERLAILCADDEISADDVTLFGGI